MYYWYSLPRLITIEVLKITKKKMHLPHYWLTLLTELFNTKFKKGMILTKETSNSTNFSKFSKISENDCSEQILIRIDKLLFARYKSIWFCTRTVYFICHSYFDWVNRQEGEHINYNWPCPLIRNAKAS